MNNPILLLQADSVIKSITHNMDSAMWIDSIVDVWDFFWVNSEEEQARTAESILAIDDHEIIYGESTPHDLSDPLVWFGTDFTEEDHAWCEDRNFTVPSLLIEVDPEIGITQKDVNLATAFIGYLGVDDD